MPKVVFSQLSLGRLPITPLLVWTLFLIAKKGAGNSNHGMDTHVVFKATMSEHYCMCAASRGDSFRRAPPEEGWDANNALPACLGLPAHDCPPCEMHMACAHCSCMIDRYCTCAASRGDSFRMAPPEDGRDANTIFSQPALGFLPMTASGTKYSCGILSYSA